MTDFKDPLRRMPSAGQDAKGRFSIGNQDWRNRKGNGRVKSIPTPEKMWELACEYFAYCDENPIERIDYKGSQVEPVKYYLPLSYTWEGFNDFLFSQGFAASTDYRYNKNENYNDYIEVIKRIEEVINNQKFVGALAGVLNPMLVARYLGLKEKVEQSGDRENPVSIQHNFNNLGLEEQKQLLELLEKANANK